MYSEDDLLPISGLQHLAFCDRRWALIHLEQQWEENLFTAEVNSSTKKPIQKRSSHARMRSSGGPFRFGRFVWDFPVRRTS